MPSNSSSKKNWRAVLLSVESGLMLGLTNFWIGPLAAVFGDVFSGHFQRGELFYFIIACVLLPGMNVWSIAVLQLAFQTGQASNMVPIQQIPIQLMPIGVFFYVYFLSTNTVSYIFGAIAVTLIIYSSFALSRRQVQIDAMGSKESTNKITPCHRRRVSRDNQTK